jgi:hypothetical protein
MIKQNTAWSWVAPSILLRGPGRTRFTVRCSSTCAINFSMRAIHSPISQPVARGTSCLPRPRHSTRISSAPPWAALFTSPGSTMASARPSFFFSYDAWRYRQAQASLYHVPTAAELGGDFSAWQNPELRSNHKPRNLSPTVSIWPET